MLSTLPSFVFYLVKRKHKNNSYSNFESRREGKQSIWMLFTPDRQRQNSGVVPVHSVFCGWGCWGFITDLKDPNLNHSSRLCLNVQ